MSLKSKTLFVSILLVGSIVVASVINSFTSQSVSQPVAQTKTSNSTDECSNSESYSAWQLCETVKRQVEYANSPQAKQDLKDAQNAVNEAQKELDQLKSKQ